MKACPTPKNSPAGPPRPPAFHPGRGPRPAFGPIPRAARAGLTLIELVIASGIIAVLLLASAAAMGENVESSEASKNLVRGAVFLESVEEDLASLSTAELLAMNGQRVYSSDAWNDAKFRAEVTCFYSTVQLLQLELRLVDQTTGGVVATIHTLKAVL